MITIQEAIEGFEMDNLLLGDCEPAIVERNKLAIEALREKATRESQPHGEYDGRE